MTPQWFLDLATAVLRNADHGQPFTELADQLYAQCVEKFGPSGSHDRSQLWPWTASDDEHCIEEHRRRYWATTPFNDHERAEVLKRWTPPESITVRGELHDIAEFTHSHR